MGTKNGMGVMAWMKERLMWPIKLSKTRANAYIGVYLVWAVFHLTLLITGAFLDLPHYYKDGCIGPGLWETKATKLFFPLPDWDMLTNNAYRVGGSMLACYDASELVVYVIVLPLLVVYIAGEMKAKRLRRKRETMQCEERKAEDDNFSKWNEAKGHMIGIVKLVSKKQWLLIIAYVLYCMVISFSELFPSMIILPPLLYLIWMAIVKNVFGVPKWLKYNARASKSNAWIARRNMVHVVVCVLDVMFILGSFILLINDIGHKNITHTKEYTFYFMLGFLLLINVVGVIVRFIFKRDCPILLFVSLVPIVAIGLFWNVPYSFSQITNDVAMISMAFAAACILITFFSHWYYLVCYYCCPVKLF